VDGRGPSFVGALPTRANTLHAASSAPRGRSSPTSSPGFASPPC